MADLVTERMKKKKRTLILLGDFHFRFSAENECPFSFSFRFRPSSSIHHKKVLVLVFLSLVTFDHRCFIIMVSVTLKDMQFSIINDVNVNDRG